MPLFYEAIRAMTLMGRDLQSGDVVSDYDWPPDLARKLTEQRVVVLLSVPMSEDEARQHAAASGATFFAESEPAVDPPVEMEVVEDLEEKARALSGKTLEEWASYSESSRRNWRRKAQEAEEQED